MLEGLLPRLTNHDDIHFQYIIFRGKDDLKRKLSDRLQGWRKPESVFVVLVDQDKEDCQKLKATLSEKCQRALSKDFIIRIACRELESWYFGDLTALKKSLGGIPFDRYRNKAKYRNPDDITDPAKELDQITRGDYQKLSSSRLIGKNLSLDSNRSHSFNVFIEGIRQLVNCP